MAQDESKSPQKVNPVLLVILGVAVIAFAVNFLFLNKNGGSTSPSKTMNTAVTAPNAQPAGNTGTVTPTNTQNPGAVNANSKEAQYSSEKDKATEEEKVTKNEYALNRNPFQTPYIYLKNNNPSPTPTPVVKAPTVTPTLIPSPTEPVGPELRLGAICQKNSDKVAIIYINGKGFIRRENERIAGTDYQVKEITEKTVVLVKDNGEEKVLRINEKALKLKGGDQ